MFILRKNAAISMFKLQASAVNEIEFFTFSFFPKSTHKFEEHVVGKIVIDDGQILINDLPCFQ